MRPLNDLNKKDLLVRPMVVRLGRNKVNKRVKTWPMEESYLNQAASNCKFVRSGPGRTLGIIYSCASTYKTITVQFCSHTINN